MSDSKLVIDFDEKRGGYFVKGLGFDFFAHFTSDSLDPDGEDGDSYIESDVMREGSDFEYHLQIPLRGATKLTEDTLETILMEKLSIYWPEILDEYAAEI